ncbi:MAG: hypothetical protein MPJ08_07825 [Nitrosopumilus sp.]|nr:hypothetical protein [Nitrosopumilus sp.]
MIQLQLPSNRRAVPLALAALFACGLAVRAAHLPADLPVILDASLYFWYASDIVILGSLPADYSLANTGWPMLLSLFFGLVDSGNHLNYMLVQKALAAVLSAGTILPIYLICRRFFAPGMALAGPAVFVFEPRIIENSVQGLIEPLFVLLVASSLACLLSRDRRAVLASFPLLALAAVTRGEALALIVPYVVIYVARYRRSRRDLLLAPAAVAVFLLVLAPVSAYKIEVSGTDALFMRAGSAVEEIAGGIMADLSTPAPVAPPDAPTEAQPDAQPGEPPDPVPARSGSGQIERFWGLAADLASTQTISSFPVIMLLVPYGIYGICRGIRMDGVAVLAILACMAGVASFGLSFSFLPRYTFWMAPFLCVLCVFTISRVSGIFTRRSLAAGVVVALFAASSIAILEDRRDDVEMREAMQVAREVVQRADAVNLYLPQAGYLYAAGLDDVGYPILWSEFAGDTAGRCMEPVYCPGIKNPAGSITYFLTGDGAQVTHLVADDQDRRRAQFLIHLYHNEDEYPYLEKVYDSADHGFSYHAKIFKVDREALAEHLR